MPKLVIEDVDDSLMREITTLAAANHVSVEKQATNLLKETLQKEGRLDRTAILASIAAMTPKNVIQTDSVEMLREDRNR